MVVAVWGGIDRQTTRGRELRLTVLVSRKNLPKSKCYPPFRFRQNRQDVNCSHSLQKVIDYRLSVVFQVLGVGVYVEILGLLGLTTLVLLRAVSAKTVIAVRQDCQSELSRLFHSLDCCSYLTSDSVYANTVPVAAW